MLPSILAAEIQASTRHFLVSAYEASDPFFHGLVRRFVEQPESLDKGPWLQLGLPFRPGTEGTRFFGEFTLPHAGYAHQEAAWRRLASNREAANTLVATGTGSGKTECFLYPVLDHCRRAHAEGNGAGIKALVIYPMNALATDQARRFAEVVASTPAFEGLRVGLYVGGGGKASGEKTMSATSVITDRDSLRKSPPDVLLTNYKMLDYLLVRPKDRPLWAGNGPETLRYVVVDELHTFDGAQGTDLALLLRRLRARLATPQGGLICAGTSATLGDGDTQPLRDYAAQIFGAPFPEESVITERRDSAAEFLGEQPIVHFLSAQEDLEEQLNPASHANPEAAIAAWFRLFFPGEPETADVADPAWRRTLGGALKQHLLLHNLLRLLKGGVAHVPTLREQLAASLPQATRPHVARVLDAFVALVAWARDPDGRPLVTVRVQSWLRELRRLVADVGPAPEAVQLRAASDLKAQKDRLYLPLVQCSDCRSTGWLSARQSTSLRVMDDLDLLYSAWFRSAPEISRLYPVASFSKGPDRLRKVCLCGRCGNLQDSPGACTSCGHPETVEVWEFKDIVQSEREGVTYSWHDKRCPACGSKDRLLLLGARSATLGAQIIEQAWASPYNDDKKLIAFSDSVQDAAHRAGFFGGRTYLNNVRMAMAQVLGRLDGTAVPWTDFLRQLPNYWRHEAGWNPEAFATEFIGPNMQWQYDWAHMLESGRLETDNPLLERVAKRLSWQAVAEFTYLSTRGRTLERVGLATLAPDPEAIEPLLEPLRATLAEQFGLREVKIEHIRQWIWGFLLHLKRRGAVTHPEMASYFQEGGLYSFSGRGGRELWLPGMTQWGPHPVFLTLGRHRDADRLTNQVGQSWYQRWLSAALGRDQFLMPAGAEEDIYRAAIDRLAVAGVLSLAEGTPGTAVGLNADGLKLHLAPTMLRSAKGRRRLAIPGALAGRLSGMPCLDAMQETYEHEEAPGEDEDWMRRRFNEGNLRRVLPAEHTGLLERDEREALERRFKSSEKDARPWYENLLSATPTLEMGVDIGSLSSVMLCSVPPSQASFLQRIGRAGRRDGNAYVVTLADGASPHDLYFYEQPMEMMAGQVTPPGVFLEAAEVLRRQLMAFCIDAWVATGIPDTAFPDKTGPALDAIDRKDQQRFPYPLLDFIQKDDLGLLERFFGLMGEALTPRVQARLRDYMLGSAEVDSLRMALLKALEELAGERSSHRKRAETIKARVNQLKARTQDEATQAEIDSLSRERDKALELSREIASRDLLGTLTDAGLIPNYAFPEAGVELKSVIWRKRAENEAGQKGYVTLPTERYERPAASALSELAPENRFYANRRHVEIDQVNMQLARVEPWRLCPSCHHAEALEAEGDNHPACPRCGDPMWVNVSQKRMLLRFRQAMANSDDRKSRIDDTTDDREPKFFARQLLADIDPKDVTIAWKLESQSVAFGFEFIRKATFRDINFGEAGRPGDTFRVADRELARPGFKLCRHCGMVQKPPRARRGEDDETGQSHARDCQAYGSAAPENIIDCLYLYREFSSEALRILVPYTTSGMDETVLQSFMASLQLGLKKRFGGKVDHLRITTQEEPDPEGGTKRQYVLLYDSVPGGTGYLHQLLSEDAESLGDVIRAAYTAIRDCSCRENAERDGCYRCLYQYRQGRAMALVSRKVAEQVLGDLVEHLGSLTRVTSISQILINPNFDSVLEARFIEALQKREVAPTQGSAGTPMPVRLIPEIVEGSSGYLLEVGAQRWWVRPQVDLGPSDGVQFACRPDFLLVPVRKAEQRRSIAVFADGWAFHKHCLREDARKRSALVASGRHWVWSVTWEDVQQVFDGNLDTDHVLNREARLDPGHPVPTKLSSVLGVTSALSDRGAISGLLTILGMEGDTADLVMARRAAMASARMALPTDSTERPLLAKAFDDIKHAFPDGAGDGLEQAALTASRSPGGPFRVFSHLLKAYTSNEITDGLGAVLLDPSKSKDDAALRAAWRDWLHAFNILQALPNHLMMESSGLEQGDYAGLAPSQTKLSTPDAAAGDDWSAAIGSMFEELRAGAKLLESKGLPPPEVVGFEHAVENGAVEAEAELAWISRQVVVLAPYQIDYASRWTTLGWRVVVAMNDDWTTSVLKLLESQ